MKLKPLIPFLLFLCFFVDNQLRAQYTGGNGDGYTVIATIIVQLDGRSTSTVKYTGGDYDGYTLLSSVILQLDGQVTSSSKYAGGSYDGYTLLSGVVSQLDGQQTSIAKYTGGNYDGYTLLSSVILQLDGQATSSSKYAGGNYDGYTLLASVVSQLDGQQTSTLKYTGGSYDGHFVSASDLLDLDGTLMLIYSKYKGGEYDGSDFVWSNETYLDGSVYFAASKYYGGGYDGYVLAVAAGGNDISLPVTLTLFALSEIPLQTAVKIEWQTASEIENAYWLLFRKSEKDSIFAQLQKFEGQGNSSAATDYSYTDNAVKAGITYSYQLADVSIKGQITYHLEKTIRLSLPKSFELFQNYPNPFNPKTVISYQLPVVSSVEISISNILGQKVAKLVSKKQVAGTYKVEWDASPFASGMYFIRFESGRYVKVRKCLLIK